jgi:putative polyhydroxyalkanoic acid system protein
MSRPVTITLPHNLGKDEARRRIAAGFANFQDHLAQGVAGGRGGPLGGMLLSQIKFTDRWEGDRLVFAGGALGQAVTGRIDVADSTVVIEVDLPDVLAALAERVKGTLQHEGVKMLEKND